MSYKVKEYTTIGGQKRADVLNPRGLPIIRDVSPPVAYRAAEGMELLAQQKQERRA